MINYRNLRRPKNYLLFPGIQLTLMLSGWLVSMCTFLLIWWRVQGTFKYLKEMGEQLGFRPTSAYFRMIEGQQNLFNHNIVLFGIIGSLLSGVVVLILSHRIVGPIYRLKTFFIELSSGQKSSQDSIPQLQFRDNDYFKDLAMPINKALSMLKK